MPDTIRRQVTLAAEPHAVFEALSDQERFAEVTGQPARIDAKAGGAFSRFNDQITGRIIEMVPGERLVEAWRVAPWAEGKYSIVRFDLEAADNGTALSIEQDGHPADMQTHLDAGWQKMYLDPLTRFFGGKVGSKAS